MTYIQHNSDERAHLRFRVLLRPIPPDLNSRCWTGFAVYHDCDPSSSLEIIIVSTSQWKIRLDSEEIWYILFALLDISPTNSLEADCCLFHPAEVGCVFTLQHHSRTKCSFDEARTPWTYVASLRQAQMETNTDGDICAHRQLYFLICFGLKQCCDEDFLGFLLNKMLLRVIVVRVMIFVVMLMIYEVSIT